MTIQIIRMQVYKPTYHKDHKVRLVFIFFVITINNDEDQKYMHAGIDLAFQFTTYQPTTPLHHAHYTTDVDKIIKRANEKNNKSNSQKDI